METSVMKVEETKKKTKRKRGSIGARLLVVILAILLVSNVVNTVFTAKRIQAEVQTVMIERAQEMVYEIAREAELTLNSYPDPESAKDALIDFVRNKAEQDNITYAIVINTDGQAFAHSVEEKQDKVYEDDYTLEGCQQGIEQFSRWYADSYSCWAYDIMTPIYLSNGTLFGCMDIAVPESGITDVSSSVIKLQAAISVASFIIAALIIILLVTGMTREIKGLSGIIDQTSKLDFTDNDEIQKIAARNDEIGGMAETVGEMRNTLRGVMNHISTTVEELSAASSDLNSISTYTVNSTNDISASIGQVAGIMVNQSSDTAGSVQQMNQLSDDIDQLIGIVYQTVDNMKEIDELSTSGAKTVNELESWSAKNMESSNNVSRIVDEVNRNSGDISSIVDTITNIASQTNLLALNASIEAARAGVAGKGFAVVAEEIRNLSAQTSDATEDIMHKIEAIQSISQAAVDEIGISLDIVKQNVKAAENTKVTFDSIKNKLDESVLAASAVSSISQQMTSGKNTILQAMQEISTSAETSSETADRVAQSAEDQLRSIRTVADNADSLNSMADSLKQEIDRFKL